MMKRKPPFIFLQLTFVLLLLFISNSLLQHQSIFEIRDIKKQSQILPVKQEKNIHAVTVRVTTPIPTSKPRVIGVSNDAPKKAWGVAQRIDDHSWTMNVSADTKIGTAQEIFAALNAYRHNHGVDILSWDGGLAAYAQSRANGFSSSGVLDAHAGFNDFVKNQDGFHKLGFMSLGENSCLGYKLEGVHIIEWVFAGDAPHNDNQLNSAWSHVGIGVSGQAVDVIFGGNKM